MFVKIIDVYINNIKMLYFEKIYASEGIDANKASASKECITCYYW